MAEINDINSAINKAGRQRMLSQRMAKAYLQIGQKIDTQRSTKILESSVALFDQQLVELKNYAPTPETRNTYAKLEKTWLTYKDVLIGIAPGREGAKKVMEISDAVLQLSHEGTLHLVSLSKSESGPLVGVAGRQRMLSQRMAKLYQAINWGVASANETAELGKARGEFTTGLKALSSAPGTSQAIRGELELARQQWMFFETALGNGGSDKAMQATTVATTSERLLDAMDRITLLFEKMEAK
ncbi:MAG: type IV pili methyl-accepting chemotaxis transducer N-terminal domain-containing protein [Sulfuricella sp.]